MKTFFKFIVFTIILAGLYMYRDVLISWYASKHCLENEVWESTLRRCVPASASTPPAENTSQPPLFDITKINRVIIDLNAGAEKKEVELTKGSDGKFSGQFKFCVDVVRTIHY